MRTRDGAGIPGSNEGAPHHPNGATQEQLYGGTVAEALAGARDGAESPVVAAPGKSVELHQRYATAVHDGTGGSVAYTYGRLMAAEENW